jgi:hypothetical protein
MPLHGANVLRIVRNSKTLFIAAADYYQEQFAI